VEQIEHAGDLMAAVTDGVGNPMGEGEAEGVGGVADSDAGAGGEGQDAAGEVAMDVDNDVEAKPAEGAREGKEAAVAAWAGFGPKVNGLHIRMVCEELFVAGPHANLANVLRTMLLPCSDGRGQQNGVADEGRLNEKDALRIGGHAAKIRLRIHLSFVGMARWIALDIGGARTGVAVTDRDALIASPLTTCATAELLMLMEKLVAEEPCAGFVMGHAGPGADSTPLVEAWKKKLQKAFPGKRVEWVDESFSSREAREAMVFGGMKKKKRQEKGATDRIAAALILQRFLDGPVSRG
jgi:putative Holliday junction resolvase